MDEPQGQDITTKMNLTQHTRARCSRENINTITPERVARAKNITE